MTMKGVMAKNALWLMFSIIAFTVIVSLDSDVWTDDSHIVLVNILAKNGERIDDADVKVYVYDHGAYESSRVDVPENKMRSAHVPLEIGNGGDYEPVRVVLWDNNQREVKHVWTWIG
jgi:hypothetical protein